MESCSPVVNLKKDYYGVGRHKLMKRVTCPVVNILMFYYWDSRFTHYFPKKIAEHWVLGEKKELLKGIFVIMNYDPISSDGIDFERETGVWVKVEEKYKMCSLDNAIARSFSDHTSFRRTGEAFDLSNRTG